MLTYERVKLNGIEAITRASAVLMSSDNHKDNKILINAITEAADLLLALEEVVEAHENGDLEGMMNVKINSTS